MDETEQFYDLVKKNSLLMWNVAAVSYLSDLSSQPLISAMRSNRVSEYLKEVREFSSSEDYREISKKIEPAFLSMVLILIIILSLLYLFLKKRLYLKLCQCIKKIMEIEGLILNLKV